MQIPMKSYKQYVQSIYIIFTVRISRRFSKEYYEYYLQFLFYSHRQLTKMEQKKRMTDALRRRNEKSFTIHRCLQEFYSVRMIEIVYRRGGCNVCRQKG